ncbi:MAG: hypothetical protein CMJ31_08760 [Phycisphaerae bacterium]|nr:hypothetical protein [Phycisphaerae bacterium]
MQDLKADTVRFLTRKDGGNTDRDRDAAKLFAHAQVEARHVDDDSGRPTIDVLIHAPPGDVASLKHGEAAGRIENAVREAAEADVRYLQWVESSETEAARPGSGIGDGTGPAGAIEKAPDGKPPIPHFDSQGHGSAQSPKQPGDRQINPPPNPRR